MQVCSEGGLQVDSHCVSLSDVQGERQGGGGGDLQGDLQSVSRGDFGGDFRGDWRDDSLGAWETSRENREDSASERLRRSMRR